MKTEEKKENSKEKLEKEKESERRDSQEDHRSSGKEERKTEKVEEKEKELKEREEELEEEFELEEEEEIIETPAPRRRVVSQVLPVQPESEERLERIVEEAKTEKKQDENRKYVEFKSLYESGRGEQRQNNKYDLTPGNETRRQEEADKRNPMEEARDVPVRMKEEYRIGEEGKEERSYETKVNRKRL